MSTRGMAWEDQALPKSISARDWLIGVLAFLTFAGVIAGVGRLFLGLQASTTLTDASPP